MMKPNKIRALLIEHGVKQVEIARTVGVSPASINKCIEGTFVSRRIRELIAERAETPFEKMWGKAA